VRHHQLFAHLVLLVHTEQAQQPVAQLSVSNVLLELIATVLVLLQHPLVWIVPLERLVLRLVHHHLVAANRVLLVLTAAPSELPVQPSAKIVLKEHIVMLWELRVLLFVYNALPEHTVEHLQQLQSTLVPRAWQDIMVPQLVQQVLPCVKHVLLDRIVTVQKEPLLNVLRVRGIMQQEHLHLMHALCAQQALTATSLVQAHLLHVHLVGLERIAQQRELAPIHTVFHV